MFAQRKNTANLALNRMHHSVQIGLGWLVSVYAVWAAGSGAIMKIRAILPGSVLVLAPAGGVFVLSDDCICQETTGDSQL